MRSDLAERTGLTVDLDAEKSVLGAILLTERSLHTMVLQTGLTEHDFYRRAIRPSEILKTRTNPPSWLVRGFSPPS
jgi:hypothetical protein